MSDSYNISGNFAAQNVTVGSNNMIVASGESTVEQANQAEVGALLAQLLQAIEGLQGPPEQRAALIEAHAQISEELQGPAPSKDKLLAKLSALKQLAGPAASISQAVAALISVISALV